MVRVPECREFLCSVRWLRRCPQVLVYCPFIKGGAMRKDAKAESRWGVIFQCSSAIVDSTAGGQSTLSATRSGPGPLMCVYIWTLCGRFPVPPPVPSIGQLAFAPVLSGFPASLALCCAIFARVFGIIPAFLSAWQVLSQICGIAVAWGV